MAKGYDKRREINAGLAVLIWAIVYVALLFVWLIDLPNKFRSRK